MSIVASLALAALSVAPLASVIATPTRRAVNPTVSSAVLLGNVGDPKVNRDGLASVTWGTHTLWISSDSQPINSKGQPTLPIVVNSGSFTVQKSGASPNLTQFGPINAPFFPLQNDECNTNTAGACNNNNTRWVLWPGTGPVTRYQFPNGYADAVQFIAKPNINDSNFYTFNNPVPTSQYLISYDPVNNPPDQLPSVSLVNENFWSGTDIPFGLLGSVTVNSTTYLYGKLDNGDTALAKVPAASLTDPTKYSFYVNGAYTTTKPKKSDNIGFKNFGAGGSGDVYFSPYWNSYVWIGGSSYPGAAFYISTAPNPQGPWTGPTNFLTPKGGNSDFGAYGQHAHFGLTTGTGKDIYISFTNQTSVYTTPLIHVTWV